MVVPARLALPAVGVDSGLEVSNGIEGSLEAAASGIGPIGIG